MAITMAFQPIVDIETGAVFSYEALVRGANGQSAGEVLASVGYDLQVRPDVSGQGDLTSRAALSTE
jgi:predicted signal transduction protein with EAL and GGDEF domain